MNIIFITNEPYPFGMGAPKRIKLFSEFFVKNNHDVKVLVSNQDKGVNKRAGKHKNVGYTTMLSDKFPRFMFYLIYPFLAFYQLVSLRKNNIKNVLIIFDGINLFNLQFIIFGKIFGYKVILDIVEDKIHSSEKMSVVAKFHIRVSEIILPYFGWLIDGVVVISTTLKKKYKLLFQKIDVELIPCSATNLDFSHKRKTNPEKEIIITYAGSFSQKDGVEYLIDAFCEISKNNKDLLLVLLGGSKKVIKDKVLLKNITNIEFVDYLPDADYWQKLSESDILCMTRIGSPYANAGFPFKLGEYLATGNPVVATDVSDISYYLKDKQDFVMAKPSDTNSLISALEYLIKHPELRRKIGINGHNKCRKFFNPEINSQTLLRFVEKI